MTTMDDRTDEDLVEVFDDPARGRRRMWRTGDGHPVRVEMADGTTLTVHRDDANGTLRIVGDDDTVLVGLAAGGATVPAALRAMGLTPAQAAEIDRTHRLTATDPGGITRTELSERTVRVQRGATVLRIDTDDQGRPRRITLPGYDDLICRWADGHWVVHRLDGPDLLTISESHGSVRFETAALRWSEQVTERGTRWSDQDEIPLVDTELDIAGRITRRIWHGGRTIDYTRDDQGALSGWTETNDGQRSTHRRQYCARELRAQDTDGARTVVRTDDGGRVRKLVGPQHTVTYDYDANGRRTARASRGHRTDYRYDPLGQLRAVTTPERTVEYDWDALGRRISVTADGTEYREHRDPTGRLWSVTTASGEPVCRFLWWNGRVIARCDADDEIDEVYVTDLLGTLLGVASAAAAWRFEDAMQPPFGAVAIGAGWRPTLFGHMADGCSGLICFGARELDPETGSFLTPDPWHGDPDDPRRLAGQPAATLPVEMPAAGVHAYALSQYDPLGRPDRDGHFSGWNFFLTLVLGPTWGAPLTSLSVFLFAPLNFYFEIINLFGLVWPQHSMFDLRGLSGSSRLATAALALNGFWPRCVTGLSGDRCITIGHVVWESRHYFHMLDRPRIIELDDIGGSPGADGKPSLDGRRFSGQAGGSILVITSTDDDHREWVHASFWTRGPGNAVGTRGGQQTFADRVKPGVAHARGTVVLAAPMPPVMPAPTEDDDDETLRVDEYLGAGGQTSTADLIPRVWFAINVPGDAGISTGTVIGVSAGNLTAAYGAVLTVVPGAHPVAVLDHDLPARFTAKPDLRDDITVQKLTASTASSAGWVIRPGAAGTQQIDLAAPGHTVAVGDVFRCAPTTPDPATPERADAYTKVEAVSVAVTVTPTLGGAAVAGATLYRLAPEGTAANGQYPGPPDQPAQVTFSGDQPFAVGDLVQVISGTASGYGRVNKVDAAVPAGPPGPEGEPGTAAVPASITLDEPLTGLAVGAVRVARLKETNREIDKGTGTTQAADVLTVKVTSTGLMSAKQPVLIDDGADPRVREISAIGTVSVDTVDPLIGTGPFTLTRYTPEGSTIGTKMSAARFIRHTGGGLPSAYGAWPTSIMGVVPVDGTGSGNYSLARQPSGWRYFLQATPRPAAMHPDFNDYWQPVSVAGSHYWLLSSQLKIVEEDGKLYWEPDAFDNRPRRYRQQITPDPNGAFQVVVREFVKSAVTRPDAGGGKVFAFPGEVQVPEEPRARWTMADALADHELVHTLQNTWWGPILGALPLQGVFRSIRDVLVANDADHEDVSWMDHGPNDLGDVSGLDTNWFELVSIGGLMQIIWSFVILAPALPDDDARKAILSTNFDDWAAVFNPLNQAIINAIPQVRASDDESKDWRVVLGRLLTRALDLKAWTPLVGFIKLILPDSERNFLEQQASRKSGNLYSNILSVDDKFNADLTNAPDIADANVTAPLGDAVRLMSFYDGWQSRNTAMGRCDADGSGLVTCVDYYDSSDFYGILQFTPAAGTALLPAELYERVSGAVPTTLRVDGPPVAGGGATTVTELLEVSAGTVMRPRLRAVVPIPPRVFSGVGCYLLPAGPGAWQANIPPVRLPLPATPSEDRANTDIAIITIDSTVTLGDDPVAWSTPAASGAAPTGPGIARFIAEKQTLKVAGRNTTAWQAAAGAGVTVTARPAGAGWDLTVDPPAAGTTLPTDVRVRIWAPVRPTDADLFDLDHPDAPTLTGKRSYIDDEFWIPVRDFLITVTDLPALPPGGGAATMAAAGSFDLELPIKVAGPASIVPAGKLLQAKREGDVAPRGERWRFTAAKDKFVEFAQNVDVVVRFGAGVERKFTITVSPDFTLDAAAFEVTAAAPLDLTITGGSGPFELVDDPPGASRARVDVAGTTVTVTIAPLPPVPPGAPAPPAIAPITWSLKIRDHDGKLGVRTVTLRP